MTNFRRENLGKGYGMHKSAKIKEIVQETENVKTFILDFESDSKPGQFVELWIPRVDEKPMSIAYSDGKELWVTVFKKGPFSSALHEKKVGDLLGVRGPFGTHYTWEPGQRLVMMAGGYGAAPLYFLTQMALNDGCKVDFVLGARDKENLLYVERLKALDGVELNIATDDGSEGHKGYNTEVLEKLIGEAREGKGFKVICEGNTCRREEVTVDPIDKVYSCGPEMMMKKVSDMCFEAGITAEVSVERYMKCGHGVCGQCSVDESGHRMCVEGPVVDNETARKIKEFGSYHRDSMGKIHNF
ncbi:dihydroorotate dehydrogenase electron transfer subunit [Candidatus Peregrinibacteria bacterium]|nr:dihydroorotate dehydrogenase electron transfer subunit [Candidatus Peregrinibacteria bacterium]